MKHLRFDIKLAYELKEVGHPKHIMEKHGISFQHETPQSIGECCIFWNCENYPSELPSFLQSVPVDPLDFVGIGLTQELAEEIKAQGES